MWNVVLNWETCSVVVVLFAYALTWNILPQKDRHVGKDIFMGISVSPQSVTFSHSIWYYSNYKTVFKNFENTVFMWYSFAMHSENVWVVEDTERKKWTSRKTVSKWQARPQVWQVMTLWCWEISSSMVLLGANAADWKPLAV